jgi:alkanesulfonate monooxygenase SsuD/methylene tetrahydromethanopterin reductase-like flavin-dependent oxidoreductase (luciferase family)
MRSVATSPRTQISLLASSVQQAFVALRTGTLGKLKPPVVGYLEALPYPQRAMLDQLLSCSAIGAPATVKAATEQFIERTGADELMIVSQIFDDQARLRSYELLAECLEGAAEARRSALETAPPA